MTNWLPDLSGGVGPYYQRLADRIESDIDGGVLAEGEKLPPQRNLAFDLGVTVGTVGRAYSLLRERGLISGEIGRGTYVLPRSTPAAVAEAAPAEPYGGTRLLDPPSGKLRLDSTAAPDVGQGAIIGETLAAIVRELPREVTSYARRFPDHWFQAGSRWLARGGFAPEPANVVPTLGAHAAIIAAIAAATAPGDHIACEPLTYSQITRGGELIGRRACLVAADEGGMIPDEFERVCARQHPRVAFLMPTAQNPTLATLDESRRRAIAEIARKYNVWLIEDDLYGALTDDPTPVVAALAPERTFFVGGLSKSVGGGIRGGWVACPPHFAHRVRLAHKMVTGGMPFLLAELSARLVMSGAAHDIRKRSIAEINARLAMVDRLLAGHDFRRRDNVPFFWLALPEPWLSGTFKKAAFADGVLLDDEDEFRAGRSEQIQHRVRIGISAERDRAELERGLLALRRLLDSGRAGYDSFI
jgi:DNA-binding transcriptional MocR family regulator